MTKQEFKDKVGVIADFLTEAMYQYKDGMIDIDTFKKIMKSEMEKYPYEWGLAREVECEYNDELEYGELYTLDEMGETPDDFKEFVEDFIADAHNWDESRFTTTGSNSFLFCLVGEEGEDY